MGKFSIKKTFNSVKNHVNNAYNSAHNSVRPYVGSILGTLAAPFTLGQSMQWGAQYDMMKMQNQMQNEQIERQNELNMQMWNLQNEYNSPASQMQRYRNSGLNPNLIYGNISSGNASTAPEMTATNSSNSAMALASVIGQAGGDISNFSRSIAKMMLGKVIGDMDLNMRQKEANIQNTKANTKQVLKSVDNQAPSPILRSDPKDSRNSDPIWTREKPFDDKSSYGKILNTADTVGRYINEKYQDWRYISRREQAHRDWIFQKQLDKGKSWEEAERIAYGKNGKYYFR